MKRCPSRPPFGERQFFGSVTTTRGYGVSRIEHVHCMISTIVHTCNSWRDQQVPRPVQPPRHQPTSTISCPRVVRDTVSESLGRVAEWQTRWLQVPVSFGTWGFKSPFAHRCTRARPMLMESMGLARFTRILWGRSPHAPLGGALPPEPPIPVLFAHPGFACWVRFVLGCGVVRGDDVGWAHITLGALGRSLLCSRWSRHSLSFGAITGRLGAGRSRDEGLSLSGPVAVALAMKRCDFSPT